MAVPAKFIIEGLDRVGKDTLIEGIQHRHGYHQVLHFSKPRRLDCYAQDPATSAERRYQEASFSAMFHFLCHLPDTRIICNRAHLGECVYAPIYRGYPGDYVFELERRFDVRSTLKSTRMVLLVEDFTVSAHFVEDGNSLGGIEKRRDEQRLFLEAFDSSIINDKRIVCVTDRTTGGFRPAQDILDEALA